MQSSPSRTGTGTRLELNFGLIGTRLGLDWTGTSGGKDWTGRSFESSKLRLETSQLITVDVLDEYQVARRQCYSGGCNANKQTKRCSWSFSIFFFIGKIFFYWKLYCPFHAGKKVMKYQLFSTFSLACFDSNLDFTLKNVYYFNLSTFCIYFFIKSAIQSHFLLSSSSL